MDNDAILQENLQYWTGRAEGYSAVNQEELRSNREAWRRCLGEEIRTALPDRETSSIRVLEVGTGPGFFAILLAEEGYDVTAVDLTPAMLSEARKNAGELAERIDFREMNAEALELPEGSFDVVVSRNLTWNLPHPDRAYAEWCRVLKPGGLLLVFDANWYGYLFREEARLAFEEDRRSTAEQGYADQNLGENFDVMEDIARRVPLSSLRRPDWDLRQLRALGMEARAEEDIWQRVWSEEEKVTFASTPLFLVSAKKPYK